MHLIYESVNGNIQQSDNENCFFLDFKSEVYKLKVCSFIALKSKLDKINIEEILLSASDSSDIEIISLCNNDRILVLTIEEVIELRELLAGAMVMIELNSIVHQRIHRALV